MIKNLLKIVMVLTFFSLLLSTMALAQLEVKPESKDVFPNDRTSLCPSFVAYITNPTENPITYKLDSDIPDGWYLAQELGSVTVEPGETEKRFVTLFVTVVIPANALAGIYPLQLSATQTGQPPLVAEFKVNVKQVRGVKINPISEGERVKGGEEIRYSFQIRNTGNVEETFRLDVFSSNKWKAKLAERIVTVSPHDKEKVDVVLTSRVSVMVEDVLTLKAVSEDGIVTGATDITTRLIPPPPEKVKGTLTKKVPAHLSLSGSGSITKEKYSYSSGFNTGGNLTKDRWFNLHLGVPYIVDEDVDEYYRLDYGYRGRWELNLGDINTDLGPLTKWQGRGGKFQTFGQLSLTLAGTRNSDEERDRYGAKLEIGKRTKLGLVYLHSPELKENREEKIYSLQLSQKLTENWDVLGEYAIAGDEEKDKAWQLESNLETENTDLNVEYYQIGKDYPLGLAQNEEKISISGWSRPWNFSASYETWRNVENHFNGKMWGIEKIIGRSFRLGYDWEERRDTIVEKKEGISAGLNIYKGPFSLYASGRWKKELEAEKFDFAGYDGRLGIRIGDRLDTWYIREEDKSEEKGKDEVGLNWRLGKITTATLKSTQERGKEEKTDRISIDLGFQLSSFYFSIGEEREVSNGVEDWRIRFSIGKSFNLPTWVKDKGRIVGYMFVDLNGNGIYDGGEGLSGIILTIRTKQAITKDGQFIFPPMQPGHYQLYVELPPGYEPQVDLPIGVKLKEGKTVELMIPVEKVGMVFGTVYYDENKNGKRDDGETGVGNVEITQTGMVSKSTFTNVNGKFFFTIPIGTGKYKLVINEATLPRRYFATQKLATIEMTDNGEIEILLGIEKKEREVTITFGD